MQQKQIQFLRKNLTVKEETAEMDQETFKNLIWVMESRK